MIRIYDVVLRDGLINHPFAPNERNIAPLLAAGLVAAGSNLLGNIMGSSSNASSNETNLEIARMNQQSQRETNKSNEEIARMVNAYNYRMFNEQNAFNLDMWNKNNSYNSPSAQVQRLLAAGINPTGVIGAGNSDSPVSSVSAYPAEKSFNVAPQLDYRRTPYNYDFSPIGDAALQAVAMKHDALLKESQINYNDAKTEYELQSIASRLRKDANDADRSVVERDMARKQYEEFMETWQDRRKVIENQGLMTDKALEEKNEDIRAKKLANDVTERFGMKMKSAEYNHLVGTIRKIRAEIQNLDEDTALKIAQRFVELAKKEGLDISNEQADALVDIVIEDSEYSLADKQKAYNAGKFSDKYLPGDDRIPYWNRKLHDSERRSRQLERSRKYDGR